MANNNDIRYNVYINDKQSGVTMGAMYGHARKLKSEISRLEVGSKEWINKMKELDQVNKQLKPLQQRLRGTRSVMDKLKTGAMSLLPAFGFAAILTGLGRMGKGLLDLRTQMEQFDRKSRVVFGQFYNDVATAAKTTSHELGLTNKEFIHAAANAADLLVPIGFTREKAAGLSTDLTKLSGALDEWSGGSLGAVEINKILTKALLGETEQMKQLGIVIDQSSKAFNSRVSQMQEELGYTKEQAKAQDILNQIYSKSGDAQLSFATSGNSLLKVQKNISTRWRQAKENLVSYFDVPVSQELNKQKAEFNLLVQSITSVNDNEEMRISLIEELQKKFPNYLAGVNAEKVSNDQLLAILKQVNDEYEKRIQIAVLNEELADNMTKNTSLFKQQRDIVKGINEKYEKYIANKIEGATLEQKMEALTNKELYDRNIIIDEWADSNDITGVLSQEDILASHIGTTNERMRTYNDLQLERNELTAEYQELIFEKNQVGPVDDGSNTTTTPTGGGGEGDDILADPELVYLMQKEGAKLQIKEDSLFTEIEMRETLSTAMEVQNEVDYANQRKTFGEMKKMEFDRYKNGEITYKQYLTRKQKLDDQQKSMAISTTANMLGTLASFYEKGSLEYKIFASAQAVMDTYKAANMALGTYPPPYSYIMMAASIAMGLANVAKINGAFLEGGYTGPGNRTDVAGVVHADEYVIPSWLRQDPQVAAYESAIEGMRSGSSTVVNNTTENTYQTDPAVIENLIRVSNTLDKLNERIDEGINGKWEWEAFKSGFDQMNEIEAEATIQES